ncbi:uncharacterized protein LOC112086499 [Eutrema salsugineum]|uniref:uncharacterized protein LOC112086499 n=1 Tax=Eutrema salsugineum TaxID=72664 RepID=UPI000CECED6B|nr:uncharacterized protein LOC112086499 [Eutrema salsugineum]
MKWKSHSGQWQPKFVSRDTWDHIRIVRPKVNWYRGVWFSQATPKYSFMVWLAAQNRLATGDRIQRWNTNADTACVFCKDPMETRDHLFFSCSFSKAIWEHLVKGLLRQQFEWDWERCLTLITQAPKSTTTFLLRYTFQATIYSIWRERNNRKHREKTSTVFRMVRMIDKLVKNQICSIRNNGVRKYEDGLEIWFASR